MTSEFDHEKCRQHVCGGCFRYFWTVDAYNKEVSCPYCGEDPDRSSARPGEKLVVEGDFDDPDKPDGAVYELPNGHRYEMGTRHDCGVRDCPANNLHVPPASETSSEDTEAGR